MEATVVSVQSNVTKQGRSGAYTVHIFTYQGDPYQGHAKVPTVRDVFAENRDNPQLAGQVLALQPGQRVDLNFQPGRNPNFKDLVSVTVIGASQQQQEQQRADRGPDQYQS